MAILVTGAAGFIGYHVSRALLARGEQVVGIDNLNPYYDPQLKRDRLAALQDGGDRFHFSQTDFSDHEALDRALAGVEIDRIVHLGAQAGVRYSIENPRAYAKANLLGHLNILELARHRSVGHLVYASSSSVYGGNESLPFRVEDRVDHPVSLYAATKKADELMSETYAHLYRLPQTGLRFFTVYGPWGRPDMAMWIFTHAILAGEPIQVFNHGRMRRDFTYIDDIVAGVDRLPRFAAARRRRAEGRGQRRPAPALQYRQQPPRGADTADRPDRAGLRAHGPDGDAADAARRRARDLRRHQRDSGRSGLCPDDANRRGRSSLRRLV